MITMTVLGDFKNGDYHTVLYRNGTKERTYAGPNPVPMFPETLDLKITDFCNAGCKFCHENSTLRGLHGDVNKIMETLQELPAGVEIALGGGNPLDYPRLSTFLMEAKEQGLVVNITVNEVHARKESYWKDLVFYQEQEYIHGVGISPITDDFLDTGSFSGIDNLVTHYILGRLTLPYNVEEIIKGTHRGDGLRGLPKNQKMLFLGFKNIGRGKNFIEQQERSFRSDIDSQIASWRRFLIPILRLLIERNNTVLFDNLALKQLRVREQLPELWNSLYMGPDGMFSMFIDGVRGTFSRTSTTPYEKRVSWDNTTLLDFFRAEAAEAFLSEGY